MARALLTDAEILILDEPTAALDPRAEAQLFQRFAELTEGRTTILVTHRLASVHMADRILVLKEGRLIEEGSHDVLLRQNGEYAALYRLQADQYERTPPDRPADVSIRIAASMASSVGAGETEASLRGAMP